MSDQAPQRRLAAILAADVVGYSQMMSEDEARTLATLKSLRTEILQPLLSKHHGRVIKVMGDGVLVEFASAVAAVSCAVALQEAMAVANEDAEESQRVVLRIGINLGDVMVEGGDLYGDGVNIAARLERLGEPGTVTISQGVYDQVLGKLPLAFVDLGEQSLKNITKPIRVYRIDAAAAGPVASITTKKGKPSIAVLPFTNMSEDPAQQHLSDGMTEDLITELSRYHELFVIARNSSFQYRGKSVDVKRVGYELGVEYLVEGSLRKAGDRLRVTAQLVEATTGNHIWGDKYDRDLADVFTIQDEVTQIVANTLVERVARSGIEKLRRKPTELWASYDYFNRGREYLVKYELESAMPLLQRAIELDSGYAQAYALLSDCCTTSYFYDGDRKKLDSALVYAQKALSADDTDGLCHYAMGFALLYLTDQFGVAGVHLRRAVALNPNSTLFSSHYAMWLTYAGRHREALEMLDIAAHHDPIVPSYHSQIRTIALFGDEQYEEAIEAFSQITQPQYWDYAYLAAAYEQLGEEDKARLTATEVLRLRPAYSISLNAKRSPHNSADRERLCSALRKAGIPD
jgi:TolB-like protein/class 3 adenylate cyclase/Flp pilus assembly protein TadD